MITYITQRQATLALMLASVASICLMLIYTLFRQDFPIPSTIVYLCVPGITVMTVIYWRGWEPMRRIFVVATTLFVGLAPSPTLFDQSIVQAILIPPIFALVMGSSRSIIASALTVWLLLAFRTGWQGPLVQYGLLVNFLCVTGLVVGRNSVEAARRNAERNAAIAEQQLAAIRISEERYRAISQLISDYTYGYTVDAQGEIEREWTTGASFQSITGYQHEDLHQTDLFTLYQPQDQAQVRAEIQQVIRGQTVFSEHEIITKNGEKRWLSIRRIPIWNEGKTRVIRFYGAAQDITERKQAEAQLQQLNEELEQRVIQRTTELETLNADLEAFTYSVSHDLRAPLRAIENFTRIIAQQHASDLPEQAQHYFSRIQANVQRMNVLVEDLLQLSRTSRQPMRRDTVDMNLLVEYILSDLRAHTEVAKVTFTVKTLPPCCADESLLQQVLINLLENAIKYSSKVESPTIEIGYIIRDDQTAYYVKDNGAGFDMEYVHKLFMIFQRLHSDSEFEGTGIGLATVKRIITRHNGRVWAEGQINGGATFYFTLGLSTTVNGSTNIDL